jgi:FkbM family methyltransferase
VFGDVRRLLHRLGLDVIRYPDGTGFGVALAESLAAVSSLIDVGANTGQFGLLARRLGFRGRIVSFEPASSSYRVLEKVASHDLDWLTIQLALGERAGEAVLHTPEPRSTFASLLPQSQAGSKRWSAPTELNETVTLDALDNVLPNLDIHAPYFLKIDTQGFDRRVLDGSTNTLATVDVVMVELPILPLYENVEDWVDTLDWLRGRGFTPRWFEPIPFSEGAPAEFDCLLLRTGKLLGR